MTREATQPILTVVLVDYDNIYLALRKRSEEAAKRFAKDAVGWIKEIESGRLFSPTNAPGLDRPRRIVVNRCYGNPVPRRNPQDNTTDMTSFPFVRHHFLRAGFEVVDCPPLTAQLKNSSDIKMVMDANDLMSHKTEFEEFVILSGDADFTPLLHRLRAHNRRSVIFANDYTAAAYKAICDAEIKESSLMSVLLEPAGQTESLASAAAPSIAAPRTTLLQPEVPANKTIAAPQADGPGALERLKAEIIATVVVAVKGAGGPVPLEALAERTTRALGHDRTVGSSWAGAGGFLELLRRNLPAEIGLTTEPPYLAYDASRTLGAPQQQPMPLIESRQVERAALPPQQAPTLARQAPILPEPHQNPVPQHAPAQPPAQPVAPRHELPIAPQRAPLQAPAAQVPVPSHTLPQAPLPHAAQAPAPAAARVVSRQTVVSGPAPAHRSQADVAAQIQASIARIHEACQAPPLSPPDYRLLFEAISAEVSEQGLQGAQTLSNIHGRVQGQGLSISRDDIRFVMEVVSEADPWFEQGVSAPLFAGRFRNFVVARCRGQGLQLSSDELDLIDAWFAGGQPVAPQNVRVPAPTAQMPAAQAAAQQRAEVSLPEPPQAGSDDEQFPKILRTRLRG